MSAIIDALHEWIQALGPTAGATAAALALHAIVWAVLARLAKHTETDFDDALVSLCRVPTGWIVAMFVAYVTLPETMPSARAGAVLAQLIDLILIGSVGWTFLRLAEVVERTQVAKRATAAEKDPRIRKTYTEMAILRRAISVCIIFITIAVMLLTFHRVRVLGASLLASAGIAALVAGAALRPAVSNFLAAIQIAFTQPIELNDTVVVEGETGSIEEIRFTYVTIRTWDHRRLVVPISYFTEKSFQNLSKVSTEMLGTVDLLVDYRTPLGELRDELKRILDASPQWNKKMWSLQVLDATANAMKLRALMSANDSGALGDLTALAREKLVEYLVAKHPESLPKVGA